MPNLLFLQRNFLFIEQSQETGKDYFIYPPSVGVFNLIYNFVVQVEQFSVIL